MTATAGTTGRVGEMVFDQFAHDFSAAVAAELSDLRKKQGISYRALALDIGVSERNLIRKLQGEGPIDLGELSRIAFALDVQPVAVIRAAEARARGQQK